MAETKIIPLELKALICSHLLAKYDKRYLEYFEMSPYDRRTFAKATGVAPLDITEVRKTQRRVAALLGRDPVDFFPSKPSQRYRHGTPPYTDSEVHSIRRLLGPGSKGDHRHPLILPPVPQNSSLGLDNINSNDDDTNINYDDEDDVDDNDDHGDNLFDTSIFHDNTDPNSFKLPSVFASISPSGGQTGFKKRHKRVIPMVSEQTFIDSNLRHQGFYTDRFDSSGSHNHHFTDIHSNNNHHHRHSLSKEAAENVSSLPSLPLINPHKRDNLVSMNMDEDRVDNGSDDNIIDEEENRQQRRSISIEEEDLEMTSSMMRMMSLESELTRAGSLLMDESYVPMSVTITRLAQDNTESSQLSGHRQTQHTAFTGTSKEKNRSPKSNSTKNNKSKNHNSNSSSSGSSISWNTNKGDTEQCTCKEPRPLLIPSTSPCPCCLRTEGQQHETWCLEKNSLDSMTAEPTLACNLCGKPIGNRKKDKNRKRPKGASGRMSSGSGFTRNPTTPETAISRYPDSGDAHHRRKCSSGSGWEREESEKMSSKNRNSDRSSTNDHRVRFDENVLTRHIYPEEDGDGENILEENRNEESTLSENRDIVESSKKTKNKKLFVKRKSLNHSHVGNSVNIPNLGVSVHALAYDLALKDARVMGTSKKKGRRSQGTQSGETSSGTIFSYFPLLKRPLSESNVADIGLKAKEGNKVKGKNYMKHIFGKVKIADYYPGGKKWREI